MTNAPACRFCAAPLSNVVVDLGMSPLSNAFIDPSRGGVEQSRFPLRLFVCDRCWLVQLPAFESPEAIFRDYAYFSSYSSTWMAHARAFADRVTQTLGLDANSLVVELASNDGYLLKEFRDRSIPVLGVEPARNVARAAEAAGIPTVAEFFGTTLARRLAAEERRADLIVGNNVLAHVPDLNDFVAGIQVLLERSGTATLEFPHLLRMLERAEFDTIYHEHFSYFSLHTAERVFEKHGLRIVDVDELTTHGGSLRIYAQHDDGRAPSASVARVKSQEVAAGLERLEGYARFEEAAQRVKRNLVEFLVRSKREGSAVAGYGAPAKATTLLNYCGIGADLLEYTVDRSPHKQGLLIPGVRVPIRAPEEIYRTKPDYVLILPWNIKDEICDQMAGIRAWGGRFVVPIPELAIVS
jgi:C-methyltransferase-like protein/putative zinc binding protein/methyltransferase family protein